MIVIKWNNLFPTLQRLFHEAIERENRLILDRIGKAMTGKRLDNEPLSYTLKSLSETHRKLELQNITAENYRILKRIQNVDPVYNRMEWDKDCELREKILR